MQAVVSRDVPVGPRLFEAMTKIEQIRADATVLLSGEEGQTQAGYYCYDRLQIHFLISGVQAGYHGRYRFNPGAGLPKAPSRLLLRVQ